jgi:hypothetical protein
MYGDSFVVKELRSVGIKSNGCLPTSRQGRHLVKVIRSQSFLLASTFCLLPPATSNSLYSHASPISPAIVSSSLPIIIDSEARTYAIMDRFSRMLAAAAANGGGGGNGVSSSQFPHLRMFMLHQP